MSFTVAEVRSQFPILHRQVHGKPLIYLDNAATSQKPQGMLDAVMEYYTQHNANVHRGVHALGDESTQALSQARKTIAGFFGAQPEELVLTRNSTESLNLLAQWLKPSIQAGDVIAVTVLEHHSNFVPWQRLAQEKGAEFVILPVTEQGELDEGAARELLQEQRSRLKVLAMTHVSNTLGVVVPVQKLVCWLEEWGVRENVFVALDAAQSAAHLPVHLGTLSVDAIAFSGHKIYGPMGSGGVIVAKKYLETFEPVLWGGGMISSVLPEMSLAAENLEDRFTAGTPDVASAVGLAAALQWLQALGWESIQQYEHELVLYAWEQLRKIPRVKLVGPAPSEAWRHSPRVGSVTFLYDGVHSHDVAQILDRYGVAVRSGHHCTMPLHVSQRWIATTRASFALYNTKEEIDTLAAALRSVEKIFFA